VDPGAGVVVVTLGGALAREVPDRAGAGLIAHTAREGDWVVATSIAERSASP
jgi:hypothetical protein